MTHEEQVIKTVQKVMPAVVSIVVGKDYEAILRDTPQQLLVQQDGQIGLPPAEEELPHTQSGKIRIGGGSGFIVNSDGLIVTNKHVVHDPEAEYIVTTAAEDNYPARVLARDPLNDVAILKIETDVKLPCILLSAEEIKLGQSVLAVGTALGEFQNTVSVGIVSGLSRFITAFTGELGHAEKLRGLIQTDAAINPGNSGGPLVNLEGEVIGINSAVVFGAQNIGFAIPISRVANDLEEVKKYGRIRRPFLGVRYVMVNPLIAKRFHLPVEAGAMVLHEGVPERPGVVPHSPADRAGVKEADVITEIDGKSIGEKTTIEEVLEGLTLGTKVPMKLLRGGEEVKLLVPVEEHPQPKVKARES